MAKALSFLLLSFGFTHGAAQTIVAAHIRCENKENPICVDQGRPALSLQLSGQPERHTGRHVAIPGVENRNIRQSAYRVIVADDLALLQRDSGNVWDSKKVASYQSIQVRHAGAMLEAGRRYWWRVMVWDNHGQVSAWSNAACWQMGLLEKADWRGARWIGYDVLPDSLRTVPAVASGRKMIFNEGAADRPLTLFYHIENK